MFFYFIPPLHIYMRNVVITYFADSLFCVYRLVTFNQSDVLVDHTLISQGDKWWAHGGETGRIAVRECGRQKIAVWFNERNRNNYTILKMWTARKENPEDHRLERKPNIWEEGWAAVSPCLQEVTPVRCSGGLPRRRDIRLYRSQATGYLTLTGGADTVQALCDV